MLSQESSVLYGNKICVNTYHYHFPVINNVAWLIIGLYHIKCVIEFLMLQISTRSCIYKKLHNKVRVVYPLPKWITTSLKKYPSKCLLNKKNILYDFMTLVIFQNFVCILNSFRIIYIIKRSIYPYFIG